MMLAASIVLACRLLSALVVMPPWQQPDENSHVALVELQRSRIAGLDGLPDPAREAEILRSMIGYQWWEHRGRPIPIPEVVPQSFDTAGLGVGVSAEGVTDPPTFHLAAGLMLAWLPRFSVVDDLHLLRTISALFGLLTLWVAWLGTRECLGLRGGTVVVMLLALHPQFAIISAAAAPDAVVNVLGACVWWQTVVAIYRKRVLLPLLAVWCAALAAASADRMGVPLLAVASITSLAVIALRVRFGGWKPRSMITASVVMAAAVLATATWILDAFGRTFALGSIFSGGWVPLPDVVTWDSFARFTSLLHQSWWLSVGWVRYAPPSWWTAITAVLAAIAATGLGLRLLRLRGRDDARMRTLLALGVLTLAIQAGAVYWTYFRLGNGAQGKSLFPILVPALVLLWAGMEAWVPESRRMHAAVGLVAIFAVLDIAAWGLVAIPAYLTSL